MSNIANRAPVRSDWRLVSARTTGFVWTSARPRFVQKSLIAAGVIALSIAAAAFIAPVGATTMTMSKSHTTTKSLYLRLGGKKAIVAVVDDFVANVAADARINRYFANTNIPSFKKKLVDQLCQGTGGPCTYKGKSMKASHRGLGISGPEFGALVEDLQKSLNKFKVPAREQGELIAILAPMKKDIVERR